MLTYNGQNVENVNYNGQPCNYVIKDGKLVWANPKLYLQGTGENYINTGVNPTGNTTFELSFERVEPMANSALFGSRAGYANKALNIFNEQNAPRFDYGSTGYVVGSKWRNNGFFKSYIEGSNYVVSYIGKISSDNDITVSTPLQNFSNTYPIYLFNLNDSGQATTYYSALKVHSFKLSDNGQLLRHFVPVPAGLQIGNFIVPSNGMWDLISQQFYANSGSGNFTCGKDTEEQNNG